MVETSSTTLTAILVCVFLVAGFAGGYGTAARLSDTETKHVAVSAAVSTTTPTPTPTPAPPSTPTPGPDRPAISFVAFCVDPGASGEVRIRPTVFKDGDRSEPVAVEWDSTMPVGTVVLKAGPGIENFPGGTRGSAVVGDGTSAAGQSPPRPCPAGEALLVKFEWRDGRFVPEAG